MRARRILSTLALTIVALAVGFFIGSARTRDTPFTRFNVGLTSLTNVIRREIDQNPNPDGVVTAYQTLNAMKPGLMKELASLKAVQASQVDTRTLEDFGKNLNENRAKLKRLLDDPTVQQKMVTDEQFHRGMQELVTDYLSIIE